MGNLGTSPGRGGLTWLSPPQAQRATCEPGGPCWGACDPVSAFPAWQASVQPCKPSQSDALSLPFTEWTVTEVCWAGHWGGSDDKVRGLRCGLYEHRREVCGTPKFLLRS